MKVISSYPSEKIVAHPPKASKAVKPNKMIKCVFVKNFLSIITSLLRKIIGVTILDFCRQFICNDSRSGVSLSFVTLRIA